jgi:hypothetical protein
MIANVPPPNFQFVWQMFYYLYLLSPIWAPILLGYVFFVLWMRYIRMHWNAKQGAVLLEIKLPKDVTKSPAAMEIILTAMYQGGAAHLLETFWLGKVRPWFSLELVSIGGQVHFFIWCQTKMKNIVEAQIYAQYPDVEIYEVPDYSPNFNYDPAKNSVWATYFIKEKKEGKDFYPIKTYVDYGLDKDPKEEYKIDPLTAVLEYLGSLKKGEQVWIQILIQAHRKNDLKNDSVFPTKPDWKDSAEAEIKKIKEEATIKPKKPKENDFPGFPNLTKGQVETIAAIERSVSKYPFETMIRAIYMAEKDAFGPSSIPGLIGSVRQYGSRNWNALKLGKFSDFDYPWQDFKNYRKDYIKRCMLDAYKRRSFFWPPYRNYRGKRYIMTTEELATIDHFPGKVATTPTIDKAASRKAEPPSNLPI